MAAVMLDRSDVPASAAADFTPSRSGNPADVIGPRVDAMLPTVLRRQRLTFGTGTPKRFSINHNCDV